MLPELTGRVVTGGGGKRHGVHRLGMQDTSQSQKAALRGERRDDRPQRWGAGAGWEQISLRQGVGCGGGHEPAFSLLWHHGVGLCREARKVSVRAHGRPRTPSVNGNAFVWGTTSFGETVRAEGPIRLVGLRRSAVPHCPVEGSRYLAASWPRTRGSRQCPLPGRRVGRFRRLVIAPNRSLSSPMRATMCERAMPGMTGRRPLPQARQPRRIVPCLRLRPPVPGSGRPHCYSLVNLLAEAALWHTPR